METSNEREGQERRTGPTVSKEKWINHAKAKMARGYVLIVGKQRRTANFFLRPKGFEMCAYNVAKQLIRDGIVVEAGEHHLGTIYKLAEDAAPAAPPPRKDAEEEEVDELDEMLTKLEDESQDASSAAASNL